MKYNSNNMYLQEQEASTVLYVIPSWLSTQGDFLFTVTVWYNNNQALNYPSCSNVHMPSVCINCTHTKHIKKITQNLSSKKTSVPVSHISSVSALCQTKAVNEPGARMSRSDSSHLLAVLKFNLQAFLVNTSLFPPYTLTCHRVEIRR